MAGIACPKCGKIRKIDIIAASDGWHQPPCYNCGDTGYIELFSDEIISKAEKTIMQLRREDISLVTQGGNQALVNKITEELDNCEMTNCVLYVRYGPMFLQWLRVDQYFLNLPISKEMLFDEEMWDHQRPNNI